MASLRMVLIEAEIGDKTDVADIIRLAMMGAIEGQASTANALQAVAAPAETPVLAAYHAEIVGRRTPDAAKLSKKANGTAPRAETKAPVPVTKTAEPGTPDSTAGVSPVLSRLLKVLLSGPKTPVELAEASSSTMGALYAATGSLKKRGLVESRIDDQGDGMRKWFITDAGKAAIHG